LALVLGMKISSFLWLSFIHNTGCLIHQLMSSPLSIKSVQCPLILKSSSWIFFQVRDGRVVFSRL
jgi:hypothetical protein